MNDSATRRRDGFIERGNQVTRIEAFVDASFAFAVTLLVISVNKLPTSVGDLFDALKSVPAFAATFALLTMFWYAHNRWSRRYGLDDGISNFLSLLLVFLVLIFVYPLRMVIGSFFAWISRVALPTAWHIDWTFEITSFDEITTVFAIYSIAWSVLGLVIVLLYRHAWNRRVELGLDLEERVATRAEIALWLVVPATGLLSLLIGFLLPTRLSGFQGMAYMLMGFSGVVMQWYAKRVRPHVEAEFRSTSAGT